MRRLAGFSFNAKGNQFKLKIEQVEKKSQAEQQANKEIQSINSNFSL